VAKKTRKKKDTRLKIEHRRLQDLPVKDKETQIRAGRTPPYTARD
jgi:hypothetical protein